MRSPIVLYHHEPTRGWTAADLEAAVTGINWYATERWLGSPDAAQRDYARKHLVASMLGKGGGNSPPALCATRRGILLGWPDQSIALVPYGAIIAHCRKAAGPAPGEQLTLA